MLWYTAQPGWRRRLVTSASWTRLVGLLTAYHAPSRRPNQQRGQYQCEDQWSALNTMVNAMSATVNVHNDQARQATLRLIPPTPRPCSLASCSHNTLPWDKHLPSVTATFTRSQVIESSCPREVDHAHRPPLALDALNAQEHR